MQQLTVRQASHTQLSDSRSLRMQNFTTSEKQKTLTKQTPMAMVKQINLIL